MGAWIVYKPSGNVQIIWPNQLSYLELSGAKHLLSDLPF